MAEFAGLKLETHSYLTGDNDEKKKVKDTKKFAIKQKLKFDHYKLCLETSGLQNKRKQLEKNKLDLDSLREIRKEFKKQ